jgi:hypothetical protein
MEFSSQKDPSGSVSLYQVCPSCGYRYLMIPMLSQEFAEHGRKYNAERKAELRTASGSAWSARALSQFRTHRMIVYAMLMLMSGLVSLAASAYYASFILAFAGLGLCLWGALLLYVAPSRRVRLELLDATASSSLTDIDGIIKSFNLKGKGIYLPPKYLEDYESSLVFIPSSSEGRLPSPEDVKGRDLYSSIPGGMLLRPPGLALSKLFEKELGTSFTKTDFNYVRENLPKLLIEDLEIADDVSVESGTNEITVEITNHIFKDLCEETAKLENLHVSMGCPLSSAIACALAKATGKRIRIEGEEQSQDGRTTKILYSILED